jgi:hypothetical protein
MNTRHKMYVKLEESRESEQVPIKISHIHWWHKSQPQQNCRQKQFVFLTSSGEDHKDKYSRQTNTKIQRAVIPKLNVIELHPGGPNLHQTLKPKVYQ